MNLIEEELIGPANTDHQTDPVLEGRLRASMPTPKTI